MRSIFSNAEALERLFTLASSFFLVARSETFSVRFGARCFKVLASSGSEKNKKNCSKSQESLGKCIYLGLDRTISLQQVGEVLVPYGSK